MSQGVPPSRGRTVRRSPSRAPSPALSAARGRSALAGADIRAGGFAPSALGRFLYDATHRSIREAARRPRALAEATALHLAIGVLAHPRGRVWLTTSWLMTVTHLGMLEERRTLGIPNLLTVARAALPAAEHRLGAAVPVLALLTDFVDGKLARRTGTVTRFGTQGDYLADAALWTWFTLRYESSRAWQVATFAAWALPVGALTVASFARGGMVDLPRSRWIRPAAAMEVLIGARVVVRLVGRGRRAPR